MGFREEINAARYISRSGYRSAAGFASWRDAFCSRLSTQTIHDVALMVDRAFGWMIRWRRLVRDDEKRIDVSHAMTLVAMGANLLRRNAHP